MNRQTKMQKCAIVSQRTQVIEHVVSSFEPGLVWSGLVWHGIVWYMEVHLIAQAFRDFMFLFNCAV
jgi:hypothetical protein